MREKDGDKQVIKGYVIEDVPDTPQYSHRANDPCQNSWVYNSPVSLTRKDVEIIDGDIHFSCVCGKRVKMPVAFAGKRGKCPDCGRVIKIPHVSV